MLKVKEGTDLKKYGFSISTNPSMRGRWVLLEQHSVQSHLKYIPIISVCKNGRIDFFQKYMSRFDILFDMIKDGVVEKV